MWTKIVTMFLCLAYCSFMAVITMVILLAEPLPRSLPLSPTPLSQPSLMPPYLPTTYSFSSLQVYGIKFALRGEELARQRDVAMFSGTPCRLFQPLPPLPTIPSRGSPSNPARTPIRTLATPATLPTPQASTLPTPTRALGVAQTKRVCRASLST
jgi:hypothetical protein